MPQIINGYTLVEPPHQGGMAVVYKGEKSPFSRAFKMVRADKASNNPRLCERFLREIKVMTKLEHPNIIKILDAYPYTDDQGVTSTVLEMDWLNGMDLQRYVEQKAPNGLDVATVEKIAAQVIDGMAYAHDHNILHLDIKPSNLFRTTDGHIKIIDFGIARVVGESTELLEGGEKLTVVNQTGESSFKGTLAYASPEQAVGGTLTFASDIFSFGKTLHFLLTGTTDPSAEIVDQRLNAIVDKCTVNNPKHRYQTFEEVRRAFSPEAAPTVRCSKCGHAVAVGAKFCPQCGTPLEAEKKKVEVEKCPKCGRPRQDVARFCDNCGHDFIGKQPSPTPTPPPAPTPYMYTCSKCGKSTLVLDKQPTNFCNYCRAGKEFLKPVFKK